MRSNKLLIWGIFSFAAICILLIPLIVIWYEPLSLKRSFDNPHIDSGYSDWSGREIAEFGFVNFPSSWTIVDDGNMISIVASDRNEIGRGVIVKNQNYYKTPEYLTYICENAVSEDDISISGFTGRQTMMELSGYHITDVENGSIEQSYVTAVLCPSLESNSLVISFERNGQYSDEILQHWAEAIVYWYAYKR